MLKKLLPVLLFLIGTGAGVGAGVFLRPPLDESAKAAMVDEAEQKQAEEEKAAKEYVKLNNQFVVPVVKNERVSALVVMSLSVEVTAGTTQDVYSHEPKLRDMFLQTLFDHANIGGFEGEFTGAARMDLLRQSLREVAHREFEGTIHDVLISDIVRQDM